jgi:heparin binding hemagglutinin HbhA
MPTIPTIEDVRKAGDQLRTAVTDALGQARTQVAERAESLRSALDELPTEVPTLRQLRDPAELRKLIDKYGETANQYATAVADSVSKVLQEAAAQAEKLYQDLAEERLDKLRTQPQVKKVIEQFDQAVELGRQRAESAVEDAKEIADEVLGLVSGRAKPAPVKIVPAATDEEPTSEPEAKAKATAEKPPTDTADAADPVEATPATDPAPTTAKASGTTARKTSGAARKPSTAKTTTTTQTSTDE